MDKDETEERIKILATSEKKVEKYHNQMLTVQYRTFFFV